jgi:hypothetical protein
LEYFVLRFTELMPGHNGPSDRRSDTYTDADSDPDANPYAHTDAVAYTEPDAYADTVADSVSDVRRFAYREYLIKGGKRGSGNVFAYDHRLYE